MSHSDCSECKDFELCPCDPDCRECFGECIHDFYVRKRFLGADVLVCGDCGHEQEREADP